MISFLKIKNYRGIKSCTIGDLKKVNVFIGRNNSGKSSLLESLYLASASFNFNEVLSKKVENKIDYLLNRRFFRGLKWGSAKEVLWYNYNTEVPITIELKMNSENLRIDLFEWHQHPLIKHKVDAYDYVCLIDKYLVNSRTHSVAFSDRFQEFDKFKQFMSNFKFIDVSLMQEIDVIEKKLWKDLLKNRYDKLIVEVLREGYEIEVEDLTYTTYDEGRTYQLAVKLPQTTIRVDDLGDGARYSLILIMISALSKNTVLLIEEPENHQHPSGLAKTFDMFLSLVKKNNIQVFISTHSLDFLKLLKDISQKKEIDFGVYFLERNRDGIVDVRHLTGENIDVLERMGFDPRFLDII